MFSVTCVVRPYWFLIDGIDNVTLPPYYTKDEYGKSGKAEHLSLLSRKGSDFTVSKCQRILIIDEIIAAEILLIGYIDKKLCGSNNTIPSITRLSMKEILKEFYPKHHWCIQWLYNLTCSISDIPEIEWFNKIHEDQKVDLIYTFVKRESRHNFPEFEDKLYLSNPKYPDIVLEILFEFTNLERGTLRINWGKRIRLTYLS